MNRTVLVTGAAGFLGRQAVRQYAGAGWRVIGLDDVPSENAPTGAGVVFHRMKLPDARLAELLIAEAPAVCVHCAGSASVGLSLEDPGADFRGNTILTFEMLEALRRHAPRCRFILLSSAAVYGDPATLPVSEDHPAAPLSPYGWHKLQCEMLCAEYAQFFGLPTATARIFSAYGPGLKRQVIWDICQRVLSGGRLPLHGTGRESRDFIHETDIARGLALIAEHAPANGEVYNLATGREVTIAELADQLLAELAPTVRPEFDGRATPGNPLNWRADIGKVAALGFAPQVTLEDGLREVAHWSRTALGKT